MFKFIHRNIVSEPCYVPEGIGHRHIINILFFFFFSPSRSRVQGRIEKYSRGRYIIVRRKKETGREGKWALHANAGTGSTSGSVVWHRQVSGKVNILKYLGKGIDTY